MGAPSARREAGGPIPRRALALAALVLLGAAGSAHAAKSRTAPLRLAFQVIWGDESMGEESLRDRVERAVLERLERAGCYSTVVRAGPGTAAEGQGADVLYRLTLSNLDVREDWDVSIAERTSPDQPADEAENQVVARIGFDVSMELSLLPETVALRDKRYRHDQSYRPLHGEDPREEARRMVIDDLARQATTFACKSATKLPAQIARVRSASD